MSDRKNKLMYIGSWLELLIRWLLGIIFIYASIHKIMGAEHFAKIIYGYSLFPDDSINLIAIILPFLEFFSGLALAFGIYPRSATLVILGLLFLFILALTVNFARGYEFDCGCFRFEDPDYTSSAGHLLIRDIICFIAGLYLLFYSRSRKWCIFQSGSILKNV